MSFIANKNEKYVFPNVGIDVVQKDSKVKNNITLNRKCVGEA